MYKYLILSLLVLISIPVQPVSRALGNERRIKIINYKPNTVSTFIGHYTYQSIIEFGIDETIQNIAMGTPTAWQLIPQKNRIFLKPIEDDATTNMTVITDRRIYFFEMHAEEAKNIRDKNISFIVKFVYPEQHGLNIVKKLKSMKKNKSTKIVSNGTTKLKNGTILNYEYKLGGHAPSIEPLKIFDDGTFTYIKFRDINAELPAIFQVDKDGTEALVNFRIENDLVVIERVVPLLTLRHGNEVMCIYNEPMLKKWDYQVASIPSKTP